MTSSPSNPASTTLRTVLFKSPRPRDILAQIDRLEAAYLKTFQRRLPVDLFMADLPKREYGVSAHYTPENESAVEFLREQLAA